MTKSSALPAVSTENGTISNTPVCVGNADFQTTNLWYMVVRLVHVTDLSAIQVTPINLTGLSNADGMIEFHAE